VWVYDLNGNRLGNTASNPWRLDTANADPSGVALNPAGGSELWVVDRTARKVFTYATGRITHTVNVVAVGLAGVSGFTLGVFVTGPTVMSASSSGTLLNTNLGLANGSSTNVSGGATLTGGLDKDPGATLQSNFNSQFNALGGIQTVSL